MKSRCCNTESEIKIKGISSSDQFLSNYWISRYGMVMKIRKIRDSFVLKCLGYK